MKKVFKWGFRVFKYCDRNIVDGAFTRLALSGVSIAGRRVRELPAAPIV